MHEFILDNALVLEKVEKIVNFEEHGGNPGKFESCRRFEVGFHNTYLCSSRDENSCMCTPKYACCSRDNFYPGLIR